MNTKLSQFFDLRRPRHFIFVPVEELVKPSPRSTPVMPEIIEQPPNPLKMKSPRAKGTVTDAVINRKKAGAFKPTGKEDRKKLKK